MNPSDLINDLTGGGSSALNEAESAFSSIQQFFQQPAVMVAAGAVAGLIVVALFRAAEGHRDELASAARLAVLA